MSRFFAVACSVVLLVIAAQVPANALPITFHRISANAPDDVASQLTADLTSVDATHVKFEFYNTAVIDSSICDIYFDDNVASAPKLFVGISSIIDNGTIFGIGATPGNVPAGNSLSPQFSADFSADSENQPPTLITNGVDQSVDNVGIVLELLGGVTFGDVVAALNDNSLRIGLHVQAIGCSEEEDSPLESVLLTDLDGNESCDYSDSFVNNPPGFGDIPEPGTLLLVGTSAVSGIGYLLRRRCR